MNELCNWRRVVAITGLLLLACGGTAFAQLQTGNVYGVTSDTQGAELPGVTVTLTGGGAPQVQVTDEQGQFRFLGLSPGTYRIEAALEGFSTVVFETVTVAVGRNTSLELELQPAIEDVITVTSESPLLDQRKITTGSTVNQTELEKIPSSRDPWAIMGTVPGVRMDRINVGGSESGQQSNYVGPGSDDDDSVWAVDGVVITDMAAIGASPGYYNFDAFEEMQIATGGSDVAAATGGITMNMVTKRGTNEIRMSWRFIKGDGDWQSGSGFSNGDLAEGQPPITSFNAINNIKDWGFDVGGPLWKDHLWLWGNYGEQNISLQTVGGTADDTDLESYGLKLNAQIVSSNSATLFYNYGDKLKYGRGAGPTRTTPTTWDQTGPTDIYKIEDTQIFGSSFFLTGMWSHVGGGFELTPKGGDPGPAILYDENFVWQQNYWHHTTDRPQDQYKLDGSYFFNTGSLSHELKFGAGYREAVVSAGSSFPSNQVIYEPYGFFWQARDTYAEQYTEYTTAYLQDTMTISNFTVNAGLRYDLQDGGVADAFTPGVEGWETLPDGTPLLPDATVAGSSQPFTWQDISPRLGLTYALGAEQKTLIRASYARFAEQLRNSYSGAHSAAGAYAYAYFYYEPGASDDGIITQDEIIDFADGPAWTSGYDLNPGQTFNRADANFDAPLTDEVILGVEHSLMPELVVGANVTYRIRHRMVDNERLIYDGTNTDYGFGDPGLRPEERGDYCLDSSCSTYSEREVTLPDGSTYTVPVYGYRSNIDDGGNYYWLTNSDAKQKYLGYSLTFNKRLSNRWMLRGNFTWNDWEWDAPDGTFADPNIYQGNPIDGGIVLNQSQGSGKAEIWLSSGWSYSITGLYQFWPDRAFGFNVSASINGREGYAAPIFYRTRIPGVTGSAYNIQATRNQDDFMMDDVHMMDLRLEKEINVSNIGLIFGLECFNVLNDGTVLQRRLQDNTSQAWYVTEAVSPRMFRLSVRFNYN